MAGKYEDWSQEQLIARIQELEQKFAESEKQADVNIAQQGSAATESISSSTEQPKKEVKKSPLNAFDPSKYSTRLIALKFAYLGQRYNGFEHHKNNSTPLPTIEEELWKALAKTRLINPIPTKSSSTDFARVDQNTSAEWKRNGADVNWEGCEYSKCGRTDRGVSAFGQVIGVRVRSMRPPPAPQPPQSVEKERDSQEDSDSPQSKNTKQTKPFEDPTDELPYIQLLNRVLPPDIRIYAWCPNPPLDFSARFSCKERRYKYFFTNPCFAPVPGSAGLYNARNSSTMREGWLDIDAMRKGCKELIGLHDFRNFCKIDASKQITNFQRRIFHADIEEVSSMALPSFLSHLAIQPSTSSTSREEPKVYAFTLHGSAFLWHQVRSIIAILFHIGQNLESPSLIPVLLDITSNPTRPKYEMASDAPLVLWDCIFPHASEVQSTDARETGYEDSLEWIYVGDKGGIEPKSKGTAKGGGKSSVGEGKWGRGGLIDDLWEVWHSNKIDEALWGLLMDKVAGLGSKTLDKEQEPGQQTVGIGKSGPRIFEGGDFGRAKGPYKPVLERERQEIVEVVNARYLQRRGKNPARLAALQDSEDASG